MLIIYGAGMAGLLAANMLVRHRPVVREIRHELPHNHSALLRFRSSAVQEATRIPFKRVKVQKAIHHNGQLLNHADLAASNAYSLKVLGEARPRSILNLEPGERYIAPSDFIEQLAENAEIYYDQPMPKERPNGEPCISTIPMPELMKLVGWSPMPEFFRYKPIWTVTTTILQPHVDLYQTIYFPDAHIPYYRASLVGDRLIVEYSEEPKDDGDIIHLLERFGIALKHTDHFDLPVMQRQQYGKLLPIPDRARKEFILAMTDEYGIYSLGRFATWRQILLDDIVKDVNIIADMIEQRDSYGRRLHGGR